MSVYAPQLAAITDKLKAYAAKTGAKLLFGITSPMMANARADQVRRQPQPEAQNPRVNVRAWVCGQDVMELNRRAVEVMAAANVPTVDLHAAVVEKCGPVPQKA